MSAGKPSKSALKREYLALQALGEQLIDLSAEQLASLSLDERLLEEVQKAQGIQSHGALRRQKQLIGKLEKIIFRETSTLGIRRWPVSRHKLDRRPHAVDTEFGQVEGKLAVLSDGSTSFSPEYESCRRVAEEKKVPLKEVYEAARRAFG